MARTAARPTCPVSGCQGQRGLIRSERVGRGDCQGSAGGHSPARVRGMAVCAERSVAHRSGVSAPRAQRCRRHRRRVGPAGARADRAPAPWPGDPRCGWLGRRCLARLLCRWPAGRAAPAAAIARPPGAMVPGKTPSLTPGRRHVGRRACWGGSARCGPRLFPDGSDNEDAMPMGAGRQSPVCMAVSGFGCHPGPPLTG